MVYSVNHTGSTPWNLIRWFVCQAVRGAGQPGSPAAERRLRSAEPRPQSRDGARTAPLAAQRWLQVGAGPTWHAGGRSCESRDWTGRQVRRYFYA